VKRWQRRRNDFNAYRARLRLSLVEKYGRSGNLKYQQVERELTELNLSGDNESYAYDMVSSASQYKHYQKISGVIYSQDTL
jgi:hypothetical protein